MKQTSRKEIIKAEIIKYALRFGVLLAIVLGVIHGTMGDNATRTIIYKATQALAAVLVAEMIWVLFFRKFFGRTEDLTNDRLFPILLFRGILYGAIILAMCLGL